jgi:membrane-bound metal-dependent hydrolase YbcI (DUF457 family)
MLAGHIGAGLALKSADRRVNLGALLAAALFPDLLLWTFVLAGWETVVVPADYASKRYLTFVCPFSHSLAASVVWSGLAAGAAAAARGRRFPRRGRAAAVVGAAVFSHFLLDAAVHVPGLPLAGPKSAKIGLGLWTDMPLALAVEIAVTAVGLRLCLRRSRWSPRRRAGLWALAVAVALMTGLGPYAASSPPAPEVLAASGLATIGAIVAAGFFLEGRFGLARESFGGSL